MSGEKWRDERRPGAFPDPRPAHKEPSPTFGVNIYFLEFCIPLLSFVLLCEQLTIKPWLTVCPPPQLNSGAVQSLGRVAGQGWKKEEAGSPLPRPLSQALVRSTRGNALDSRALTFDFHGNITSSGRSKRSSANKPFGNTMEQLGLLLKCHPLFCFKPTHTHTHTHTSQSHCKFSDDDALY